MYADFGSLPSDMQDQRIIDILIYAHINRHSGSVRTPPCRAQTIIAYAGRINGTNAICMLAIGNITGICPCEFSAISNAGGCLGNNLIVTHDAHACKVGLISAKCKGGKRTGKTHTFLARSRCQLNGSSRTCAACLSYLDIKQIYILHFGVALGFDGEIVIAIGIRNETTR